MKEREEWDQLDSMRKIRKPMPKPGHIIPHDEEDKFDWRDMDDEDSDDYKSIGEQRGY